MALIEQRKGRITGSGYQRLFNNQELGALFSKVQAAVISSGTELEKMVIEKSNTIDDVDSFLDDDQQNGVYLIEKKVLKKSRLGTNKEPDLVILKIDDHKKHCHIIELKDGDSFDTKKSAGEKELLLKFQAELAVKIQYTTSIHVCSFNQPDKTKIVEGFKHNITENEAMTGQELCDLLNIEYKEIINMRKEHGEKNIDFFLKALTSIDYIKEKLKKILALFM